MSDEPVILHMKQDVALCVDLLTTHALRNLLLAAFEGREPSEAEVADPENLPDRMDLAVLGMKHPDKAMGIMLMKLALDPPLLGRVIRDLQSMRNQLDGYRKRKGGEDT